MLCTEKLEDSTLTWLHEFSCCTGAEIDELFFFFFDVQTLLTEEQEKVDFNIFLLEH